MNYQNISGDVVAPIKAVGYPGSKKYHFKKDSKKLLKWVAENLGLGKGSYEVRFNAGGPAVSGEAVLHAEKLYVTILELSQGVRVMYRTCRGRKDYSGGPNNWCPIEHLIDGRVLPTMKKMIDNA